jgi:hypothetical protein
MDACALAYLCSITDPFTARTRARERRVIRFCNATASFSKNQARLKGKSSAAESLNPAAPSSGRIGGRIP